MRNESLTNNYQHCIEVQGYVLRSANFTTSVCDYKIFRSSVLKKYSKIKKENKQTGLIDAVHIDSVIWYCLARLVYLRFPLKAARGMRDIALLFHYTPGTDIIKQSLIDSHFDPGPVVQSIVSLTSPLVDKMLLTVLASIISKSRIFLLKNVSSFCKCTQIF